MELLKSKVEIDHDFKPTAGLDLIKYFNRALKFANTNYNDRIAKISRLDPRSLTAIKFLEEYVWCMLSVKKNLYNEPQYFKALSNELQPYYNSLWDLNNFPKQEDMKEKLAAFNLDEEQLFAIHETAYTANQGIKLFGWSEYQNNFLNCYSKLIALPGLGVSAAMQLEQSTGGKYRPDSIKELYALAKCFGFETAQDMCLALKKNFPMSIRTLGTILLYSEATFKTTDIVNTD